MSSYQSVADKTYNQVEGEKHEDLDGSLFIFPERKKKKVANILAKKIALHLVFCFSPCFSLQLMKKNLFKFTQNGIYTVCFSAAVFKCITFQVTMKHFFEICLNLSFGVTMKLPGSSAGDMTELGCSWPTAIIIRHCCWERGSGWGNILKENHAVLCMGEVTPWNWIVPSPRDLSSVSLSVQNPDCISTSLATMPASHLRLY